MDRRTDGQIDEKKSREGSNIRARPRDYKPGKYYKVYYTINN